MNYHKNIATKLTINPQSYEGHYKDETLYTTRITGTYLHGEIQTKQGYDIFGIVGTLPTCTGIYPAEVIGVEPDATFFLWTSGNMTHGLVVANSNKEDYDSAMIRYTNRATFL